MELSLAEAGTKADLSREDVVFEPKYDGERILLVKEAGQVALINRRKRNITLKFPEVAAAAQALPDGTAIDGELTVPELDNCGSHNCPSTAFRASAGDAKAAGLQFKMPAVLMAFDLLFLSGKDYRNEPFENRRAALEMLHRAQFGTFGLSPQMADGRAAWQVWVDFEGGEGVMMKQLQAPYRGFRSRAWIKIKAWVENDFKVTGFTSHKREVSALTLSNGFDVNCPRFNEGAIVKQALSEGKEVIASVRYLAPYRFPVLAKVEVR